MGGPPHRPPPPRPIGRRPAISCLRCAPLGYTRAVGVAGRPRASGAARSAANGSVRGGGGGRGGGGPPPWFPPPCSPGRPSKGLLRVRRPGRRRSAVGRQRAGRERAGGSAGALAAAAVPPHPGCSGLFGGGAGPLALRSASVRSWAWGGGGGNGGGPLVPWRRPLTAEGGWPGGPGPGGQPSAGGLHFSPAPLYLEPDTRAGPRWGPLSPPPSPRGAGWRGAAVRVSGQRLAGCGAVGSPPRSLSLPSLPREVARAPPPSRIVGGAWVGGPSSPPHSLPSAVWAVTCAAACVGAGAVALAGCAGGSASG